MKSQEIGKIGKITISKEIEASINYLHKVVGATEWSGILFYSLQSGDIKKLKDLEFKVEMIYPMNIGSSAYTEFDYNSEVMNAYDVREDLITYNTGLIHTHHKLGFTTFSGTDASELTDNCKNFNYYLSLIVDFSKDWHCKIAFPTKAKVNKEFILKDNNGKSIKAKSSVEEELALIGELEIEFENAVVDKWLEDRMVELKKKKEVKPAIIQQTFNFPTKDITPQNTYHTSVYDSANWKPVNVVTPKEFLASVINLDESYRNLDIVSSIASLELNEVDKDDYNEMMIEKLEEIHDNLYKSPIAFKFHCKQALTELDKNQQIFGDMEYYNIIKENLEVYAEV